MGIYKDIFNALTFLCFVLEPIGGQFLIREVNKECVKVLSKTNETLYGMSIPDAFPENPEHLGAGWEKIHNSLNNTFVNGEPNIIEALRYDRLIFENGEFEEAYWHIENIPIKNETSGMVTSILLVARNRTLEVLEKMR